MKKAKLMLTSLALVAIVGTALAFKVSEDRVYADTNGDGVIDTTLVGWKTVPAGTPGATTTSATTTSTGTPSQTFIIFTGN